MKHTKRLLALFLAVLLVIGLLPATAFASTKVGQVVVSIEDTAPLPEGDYPTSRGVIAEGTVDLYDSDSAMDVIVRLAEAKGLSVAGADSGYITAVDGLSAGDRDGMSGWMGTINDWFLSSGFGDFTVANGGLSDGDIVSIQYTNTGSDLGADWANNDKSLKKLTASAGALAPAFSSSEYSYTLKLPEGTDSIKITPTAANKNFQVRTYVGDMEYKRTQNIPVSDGTVITVKCGDPSWPSMNNGYGGAENVPGTVYTLTVRVGLGNIPPALSNGDSATAKVAVGEDYPLNLASLFTDADGDALSYSVSVNGADPVSADADYRYQPSSEGVTTLAFTANDGKASSPAYTVTLTALCFQATKLAVNRTSTANAELSFTANLPGKVYYALGAAGSSPAVSTSGEGTALTEGANVLSIPGLSAGEYDLSVVFKDNAGNLTAPQTLSVPDYTIDLSKNLLIDPQLSAGYFWTPYFQVIQKMRKAYVYLPSGTDSVDLTFGLPEGVSAVFDGDTLSDVDGKVTLSTAVTSDADNFRPFLPELLMGNGGQKVAFSLTDGQNTAKYELHLIRSAGQDNISLIDYFCLGSQYTNRGNFGLYPERLFVGIDSAMMIVSTGNFGGYATFRFAQPVANDPKNPYGLDFVVKGNSSGAQGLSEPGSVLVSQDGTTWYELAGSEHFDDNAEWDYEVSYTANESKKIVWTDKYGNTGTMVMGTHPPLNENYPLAAFDPDAPVTVSGTLLKSSAKDDYGTSAACFPDFGYSDVHRDSAVITGTGAAKAAQPKNVYTKEGNGDGFDISWAVDSQGNPVTLDSIQYVKVTTASLIDGGAIGEKSTEISGVYPVVPASSNVGKTAAPASIKVDGRQIALKDGVYTYDVLTRGGELSVEVEADAGANVYINNQRGSSRTFDAAPREGKVRVIVQEGEKEPSIYYLTLKQNTPPAPAQASTIQQQVALGSTYTVDLAALFADADGDALTYTVSINGAAPVAAQASYACQATAEGKMTLAFVANDGWADSQPVTVTLDVRDLPAAQQIKELLDRLSATQLSTVTNPSVSTTAGEWTVLALARYGSGTQKFYDTYLGNLYSTVMEKGGALSSSLYTEYSRVVLALASLGMDARDVAGYDLVAPLHDLNRVTSQGVNGAIWALIALDSRDYPVADGEADTRQALIRHILNKELSGGGWSLSGTAPVEIDVTGMAIQALAPYYSTDNAVKAAVDRALDLLCAEQTASGSWGTSESDAQVIVALTAMGIPLDDARFVKQGKTPIDGLMGYYLDDQAAFRHDAGGEADAISTDQGMYALTAYYRSITGQNFLYDMSDAQTQSDLPTLIEELRKGVNALPSDPGLADKATVTLLSVRLSQLPDFADKAALNAKLAEAQAIIQAKEQRVQALNEAIWNQLDPKNITEKDAQTVLKLMQEYEAIAPADREFVTNAQDLLDARDILAGLNRGVLIGKVFENLKGSDARYTYEGSYKAYSYTLSFSGGDVNVPAQMDASLSIGVNGPDALASLLPGAYWLSFAQTGALPAAIQVWMECGAADGGYTLYRCDSKNQITRVGKVTVSNGEATFTVKNGGKYFLLPGASAGAPVTSLPAGQVVEQAIFETLKGKDVNLRLEGETPDGYAYALIFNGEDLTDCVDFDPALTHETPNAQNIRLLAQDAFILHFAHTGALPGKMLVEINTPFADGEYLLFSYNEADGSAQPVQKVTVENGVARFFLTNLCDYFIAQTALKASVSEIGDTTGQAVPGDVNTSVDVGAAQTLAGGLPVWALIAIVAGGLAAAGLVCWLVLRRKKEA